MFKSLWPYALYIIYFLYFFSSRKALRNLAQSDVQGETKIEEKKKKEGKRLIFFSYLIFSIHRKKRKAPRNLNRITVENTREKSNLALCDERCYN